MNVFEQARVRIEFDCCGTLGTATHGPARLCERGVRDGSLLDVNMSGLAFRARETVAVGTALSIRVRVAGSERVISRRGTVVRCEASKGEGFQVVCRLDPYFRFDEIREIGRDLFASAIV